MAGFNTAVTGLKSASQMLDVAGNNIANSSTVGYKSSRTEFSDIYATSVVGAGSSNQPGSGVTVSDISQDFSAGTIEFTNNNLDLAINGSGFFQMDDGQGGTTYTRAGSFELDKDGFIVSKNGKYLQGYGLDALGNQLPLQNLSVTQKESPPKATESIDLSFNIDSAADATALSRTFDRTNPGSYTYSTTVETVDSLGNSNSIRFYMVEQAPVREQYTFDMSELASPGTITSAAADATLTSNDTDLTVILTDSNVPANTLQGTFTLNLTIANDGTSATALENAINGALDAADTAHDGKAYVDVSWDTNSSRYIFSVNDPMWVNTASSLAFNVEASATDTAAAEAFFPATASTDQQVEDILISGVSFTLAEMLDFPSFSSDTKLTNFRIQEPRIDDLSLAYDPANGQLTFEVKADSTQTGDIVVDGAGTVNGTTTGVAASTVSLVGGAPVERDANEVQVLTLTDNDGSGNLVGFNADGLVASSTISLGGVDIPLTAGLDIDEIGELVEAYERDIINKNPDIESVVYDPNSGNVTVTWKADAGNVDPIAVSSLDAGGVPFVMDGSDIRIQETKGDNSFQGQYRMYAYLNDQTALDIGKVVDPGEGGYPTLTEVGPVVVSFNPTTGNLLSINGETVASQSAAPKITIRGADPANPDDDVLDSDVDGLEGIQLDISGSSQFASESIVKAASQDGYPKGDLIGVTFAETGEMVASFSNGQRQNLGLVAIASFENQAGLRSAGATEWIATLSSGSAILNPPGTGLNGTLRSAALESSNVDLSAELVKLIEAQRNFQANSKTLETQNTVTQAILQI